MPPPYRGHHPTRARLLIPATLALTIALGGAVLLEAQSTNIAAPPPEDVSKVLAQLKGGAADNAALAAGRVVVRTQMVPDALEAAVLAAVRVVSPLDRTVAYYHQFIAYVDGQSTVQYGTFTRPATEANVAGLTIDSADLADLRTCASGMCDIRAGTLSVDDIIGGPDWKAPEAASRAHPWMRSALLGLVSGYQQRGHAALRGHDDKGSSLDLQSMWEALLARPSAVTMLAPRLQQYLSHYPAVTAREATDTIYWDKQRLTGLKPMIGVTHLVTWRDTAYPQRALVVQKQLFASHYVYGALGVALFIAEPDATPPVTYIVYSNRTRGDLLRGTRTTSQTSLRARLSNVGATLQRKAGEQMVRSSAERLLTAMKDALER